MFWVIATAGMAGYSLSLGASLWANTDRKRRELSILQLLGFRGGGIMLYPSFHALFTILTIAAIEDPSVIAKILTHLGCPPGHRPEF